MQRNTNRKILLTGCNGKMGKAISGCVSKREDSFIIAGFDRITETSYPYPIYTNISEYNGDADVIIDFSHPTLTASVIDYAVKNNIPAVIATTGLDAADYAHIKEASKTIPIFQSANMSIGVSLIAELSRKAAAVLSNNFDIEIIEKHHNQKIDAPSGTALLLADEINDSLNNSMEYTYDRHSVRKKRDKNEIGIHSIRGGTIAGEHEVIFAGHDEIISIKHTAVSREIFAIGAVNAAMYLCNQKPGLYNMKDFIASI